MQVNNNIQSPNFGMALKIEKGARKALQNCSLETLKDLERAGADLKNTKFYHVNVDDNLCCTLEGNKNAYWGPFRVADNYSVYLTEHNLERKDALIFKIPKLNVFDVGVTRICSETDAKPTYKLWGWDKYYEKPEDILRLTHVARVLDEVETNLQNGIMKVINGIAVKKDDEVAVQTLLKQQKQAHVTKTIDNLIDIFGV